MRKHVFAVLAGTAALLAAGAATAATDSSPEQAQYEKQKAACLSGQSNQDKATCLKEANAALAEAKRGKLENGKADYRKNQMDRCNALTGSEQSDCFARMKGSGTVSGSVGGGGILREQKTTTTTNPGGVTVAPQAAPPLPPPVTASGPK